MSARAQRVLLYGVQWGPYVPLGLMFVAEALRSSCEVGLTFDLPTDEELSRFDLVGISSSSFGVDTAIELARRCRGVGLPTVLGGVHGTFAPAAMLEAGFDYVVRGEGEAALARLAGGDPSGCCRIEAGGPVLTPVQTMEPLDGPYDGRLLRKGFWGTGYSRTGIRHELGPLVTSRGCIHRCLFCTVPSAHPRLRHQSRSSIEAQVRAVVGQGYTGVRIYDSLFAHDRDHARWVASLLREAGLAWIAETTVNAIDDPELVAHFVRCGCLKLEFGLESANPDILRLFRKPFHLERATRVIRMVQEQGIQVETYIVVGAPGETEADVRRLDRWFDRVMPDNLSVSVLCAYPGTELYRRATEEGFGRVHDWLAVSTELFRTAGNGQRYVWEAPGTRLEDTVRRGEAIYAAWRERGGENPWVKDRTALGIGRYTDPSAEGKD